MHNEIERLNDIVPFHPSNVGASTSRHPNSKYNMNFPSISIVSYSDSSSESDDTKDDPVNCGKKRKMCAKRNETSGKSCRKACSSSSDDTTFETIVKERLPLPGAIHSMFSDKGQVMDNPAEHGGRIRSFPHLEGNWASYVYIPVDPDSRMKTFIEELMLCLRPYKFSVMDDPHISLSRTVCIRHHWIEPLVTSLKKEFQSLQSCVCKVKQIILYTNDEKTRTFASLEVCSESTTLMEYIRAADICLQEYKLPTYYKNPSFHISLLWCVGDVVNQIPEEAYLKLQKLTRDFLDENPDLSIISVDKICLKTGFKKFFFHLQS